MSKLTKKFDSMFNSSQKTGENTPNTPKNTPTGKPLGNIHPESKYQKSQTESETLGIYQENAKVLADKPNAPKWCKQIAKAKLFQGIYPKISIITGIAFGAFIGFLSVGSFKDSLISSFGNDFGLGAFYVLVSVFGLLGYFLADWNESTKQDNAEMYYKPLPENRNSKIFSLVISSTFLSICITGLGLGFISYKFADKTDVIAEKTQFETDSIKAQYTAQIADLQAQIDTDKSVLKKYKAGNYRVNNASARLAKNTPMLNDLLQSQKSDLSELKTGSLSEVTTAKDTALKTALVSALIALLLEIFYIKTFGTEFNLRRKIETENANHNFTETANQITTMPTAPTMQEIVNQYFLNAISGNPQPLPIVVNNATNSSNTPVSSQKVGFGIGGNTPTGNTSARNTTDSNTTDSNTNSGKNSAIEYPDYTNDSTFYGYDKNGKPKFKIGHERQCDNCKKTHVVKSYSNRFCSDECKFEAHNFDLEKFKMSQYGK